MIIAKDLKVLKCDTRRTVSKMIRDRAHLMQEGKVCTECKEGRSFNLAQTISKQDIKGPECLSFFYDEEYSDQDQSVNRTTNEYAEIHQVSTAARKYVFSDFHGSRS